MSTRKTFSGILPQAILLFGCLLAVKVSAQTPASMIGREVAIPRHLQDGDESQLSIPQLIAFGEKLFTARWTVQEGAGRPLSKGTANGPRLSDPSRPLVFPFNFNRFSGPDANSCSGCHNLPATGGGGDRVTNVFVLGQRFDFISFNHADSMATAGALDERGRFVLQQNFANERKTIGMNGSGFIEMLARQMTADLQAIRDSIPPGASKALVTKGVSFGALARAPDGTWDTAHVQGLPVPSLTSLSASQPPSLVIMPFHQAGAAISLRQFTINAFNQHHGIQAEERLGFGVDENGNGSVNEMTTADVTAVTLYQATLPVPGRVISNDPQVEKAVRIGEQRFSDIGCANCH